MTSCACVRVLWWVVILVCQQEPEKGKGKNGGLCFFVCVVAVFQRHLTHDLQLMKCEAKTPEVIAKHQCFPGLWWRLRWGQQGLNGKQVMSNSRLEPKQGALFARVVQPHAGSCPCRHARLTNVC